MKKVLLAWELGDGLGHVSRLLPIARNLRDRGVECAFAVRNIHVTHPVISRDGFMTFVAPTTIPYAPPGVREKPISSIGDVLATVGYVTPELLHALTDAWAAIIETYDPDLIVTDYSPTAGLAAYGRYPIVPIGDWFTLPPGNWSEFRTFKDSPNRVDPAELQRTVEEVQRRRGRPAPDRVPALMHGERNFIVTVPELDPYHEFRENTVSSPLRPLPAPVVGQEPSQDYFAYLSNGYAGTAKALEALAGSDWTGEIYLRDANPEVRGKWRERGLKIHEAPQSIEEVVARSRVVVHHGGIGTVEQVMAMGRPQCLVPRHFEQMKNCSFVGKAGAAAILRSGNKFTPEHVSQAFTAALTKPEMRAAAERLAADLERRGPFNLLADITDHILSRLDIS